jgi:hypothetical protein
LIRQRSSPNYWADLCADLLGEFPSVDRSVLIEEIVRARAATSLFGLDVREQVRWTATIARNNLRLLTGGADLARLDPESHDRRKHDA